MPGLRQTMRTLVEGRLQTELNFENKLLSSEEGFISLIDKAMIAMVRDKENLNCFKSQLSQKPHARAVIAERLLDKTFMLRTYKDWNSIFSNLSERKNMYQTLATFDKQTQAKFYQNLAGVMHAKDFILDEDAGFRPGLLAQQNKARIKEVVLENPVTTSQDLPIWVEDYPLLCYLAYTERSEVLLMGQESLKPILLKKVSSTDQFQPQVAVERRPFGLRVAHLADLDSEHVSFPLRHEFVSFVNRSSTDHASSISWLEIQDEEERQKAHERQLRKSKSKSQV